jgi:hypothetical protein
MDEEIYRDLVEDAMARDDISDAIEINAACVEADALDVAAISVRNETSEMLLGNCQSDREFYAEYRELAVLLVKGGGVDAAVSFEHKLTRVQLGRLLALHRYYYGVRSESKSRFTPRFVAAAVLVLRAKLGRLPNSDANRIVVEQEYNRVCRNANVRLVVINTHRQHVLNAYYTQFRHERVALSRKRLPKWVQQSMGYENPAVVNAVC